LRRRAAAALALLAAGWAAILWVPPFSDDSVSDLFVYRTFAEPVLAGELPYREVFLEYPPLAAPAIALPGVLGTGEAAFRLAYAGWTFLLAAAVVLLCGALAARTGGRPGRAMLAAAAAPLLCGAVIRTHFDLAPVALTLLALLLVVAQRPRLGLAVLGLGVMTKGFPLVAAPALLAWLAACHGRRMALEAAAALAATVAGIGLAGLAISPAEAVDALTYQLDRPVQVQSTPAGVLYALDGLGLGEAERVASHRADGLVHAAADAVSAFAVGLLFAVVALFTVLAAARPPDARAPVLAALGAVAAFACLGKILSPQFLAWVVPLGALALAWRLHALAALVALAAVLTQVEFPALYFDLLARDPAVIAVVCLRDAALLASVALAARALGAGGDEQLLNPRGTPVAVGLDH
jgi:hypothetical protein